MDAPDDRSHDGHDAAGSVVDLGVAREHRRLVRYRQRAQEVLAENRDALQRLFDSGVVFTRHGSRVARDLLQAHQNLLRVLDMSSGERSTGDISPPELLFGRIEKLLDRASSIARRNRSLFRPSSTPVF